VLITTFVAWVAFCSWHLARSMEEARRESRSSA
jgi:hypothetical protein